MSLCNNIAGGRQVGPSRAGTICRVADAIKNQCAAITEEWKLKVIYNINKLFFRFLLAIPTLTLPLDQLESKFQMKFVRIFPLESHLD